MVLDRIILFTKECEAAPKLAFRLFLSEFAYLRNKIKDGWNAPVISSSKNEELHLLILDYLDDEKKYNNLVWHRHPWEKWKYYKRLMRFKSRRFTREDAVNYVIFMAQHLKVDMPLFSEIAPNKYPVIRLRDIAKLENEQDKDAFLSDLVKKYPYLEDGIAEFKQRNFVSFCYRHETDKEIQILRRLKKGVRSFIFKPVVKREIKKREEKRLCLSHVIGWINS